MSGPSGFTQQPATAADTIPRRPHGAVIPLALGQEQLWVHQQMAGAVPIYNEPFVVTRAGALDVAVLERCLAEIIGRHEALRTAIVVTDGRPAQVVAPHVPCRLRVLDRRATRPADRDAVTRRVASDQAREPFDLTRAPLLRADLLEFDAGDHRLVLTIHQTMFDGVSVFHVLLPELASLYDAHSQDRPSPLPPVPLQFGDFAWWQRQAQTPETLADQIAYWRRELDGLSALPWRTGRPRPRVPSYRGAQHRFTLDGPSSDGLRRLSRREGSTLFATALASFATLLHAETGATDVAIGAASSVRKRIELEPVFGCFINTVVLRIQAENTATFRTLLRTARRVTGEALSNNDVPLHAVVEHLAARPDSRQNPLFQAMLVMEPSFGENAEGWSVTPMTTGNEIARVDLSLEVEDRPTGIAGRFRYSTDIFDASDVERLADRWRRLLEAAIEDPGRSVKDLAEATDGAVTVQPIGTAAGVEPRLREAIEGSRFERVIDTFRRCASEGPQRLAVCGPGTTWRYTDLLHRTEEIGAEIDAAGVRAGDVVGIAGPPSGDLVAAMLAVLAGDYVLLMLDADLPGERTHIMLREAGAQALVTTGPFRVERLGHSLVPLGTDAAYVFFTSGTTGVPKGVVGTHNGLAHFLDWERRVVEAGPEDRCAQTIGLSFDPVLRDVLLPLTSGASLHVPDAEHGPRSAHLMSWLLAERITIVHTTPPVARTWVTQPVAGRVSSLRCALFSGAHLDDVLVAAWRKATTAECRVLNLYGPTETTLAKCWYEVPRKPDAGRQPAGQPLPETDIVLLGADLAAVPPGDHREIAIRTPHRTLGYLNAPDEQRRCFVANPWRANDPDDLLYLTGDLGRWRPDGLLEILGRRDDQVKVNGVRVEPGEVEAVLVGQPGVAACAVLARKADDVSDATLTALVVPAPGASLDEQELRRGMAERLPAAVIPSRLLVVDRLPLNVNGKIDRTQLPRAAEIARPLHRTIVAPRTETEHVLADMWARLLGVERVGIRDDFFELGGHSLMAIRLFGEIEKQFGRPLPLTTFLECATIEHVSRTLGNASPAVQPVSDEEHRAQGWEPRHPGTSPGLVSRLLRVLQRG